MSINDQELIVCRCEEVMEREIITAIRDGCKTLNEIKRYTRAGMGLCQSKTCEKLIADLLHRHLGTPLEQITPLTARFPIKPVKLRAIGGLPVEQKEQSIEE